MIVTHGSKGHDQSGANHAGTRKSTWKPWSVEDAIARIEAKQVRVR